MWSVTLYSLTADIPRNEQPLRAPAQKSAKPEYAVNAKPLLFGTLILAASAVGHARAEAPHPGCVQIAELDVDPAQLERYDSAAKEQIEAAIRLEPGRSSLGSSEYTGTEHGSLRRPKWTRQ
jgi:hypothetical protein